MSEGPVAYSPEVDVPLLIDTTMDDSRVAAVITAVNDLKNTLRDQLGSGPYVEQAARLADLVVQAAQQAARESGGTPSGPPEALGTAQNELAAR